MLPEVNRDLAKLGSIKLMSTSVSAACFSPFLKESNVVKVLKVLKVNAISPPFTSGNKPSSTDSTSANN